MRLACLLALLLVVAGGPAAQMPPVVDPGWGFRWEPVGGRALVSPSYFGIGRGGHLWVGSGEGAAELRTSAGGEAWHVYGGEFTSVGSFHVEGDTVYYAKSYDHGGDSAVYIQPIDGFWPIFPDILMTDAGNFAKGPPGSSAPGRLFAMTGSAVAWSDERGRPGTWTMATPPPNPHVSTTDARSIAFFPADGPWPQRMAFAGPWGVALSDDRGETWRISSLWGYLDHSPRVVASLARPGGGVNLVALGERNGDTCGCTRVYLSRDGGETWEERASIRNAVPPYRGAVRSVATIPQAGQPYDTPSYTTSSAIGVQARGGLFRTDDGGETWHEVGQMPFEHDIELASHVFVGADGKLYAVNTRSPAPYTRWVWRTAQPLVVASTAEPSVPAAMTLSVRPNPSLGSATVEVALSRAAEVEATVYDALGRRVAVLAGGALRSGTHRLTVPPLPAGAYRLRVTAVEPGVGPVTSVESLMVVR